MKLLDRYLLSQYVRHFMTILMAFISLYLLIDLVERIDNFTGPDKATHLMPQYFLCKVPLIVDQLNPFLIMLSGLLTIGILMHTHEMVALKAAGLPLIRILRPVFLPAATFTILFVLSAQLLLPFATEVSNKIWFEKRHLNKVSSGIQKKGKFYFKGQNGFYSFTQRDSAGTHFRNFSYSELDNNHKLIRFISAQKATYNNNNHLWLLTNGQEQTAAGKDFITTPFATKRIVLPEKPEHFVARSKLEYPSLTELYQDVLKAKSAFDEHKAWAAFMEKISYLLLGIPLLLMGLPLLHMMHRKWNCDLTVSIPASCCLAFVAWGMWGALQSLAKAGVLPPLAAGAAVHLLLGTVGIYLLFRENR